MISVKKGGQPHPMNLIDQTLFETVPRLFFWGGAAFFLCAKFISQFLAVFSSCNKKNVISTIGKKKATTRQTIPWWEERTQYWEGDALLSWLALKTPHIVIRFDSSVIILSI